MKQFIVLLAVLPLMLVFFVQFGLEQLNESKIAIINDFVYTAKEVAKQDGCFTEEKAEKLISDIASALNISEDKVRIIADSNVKGRMTKDNTDWDDSLLHYRVEVDLEGVMAGAKLLGIKDSENCYTYVIDSYTASEYLP